ncbi:MAG: hypothetical protein FJX77_17985 [Armatimonadetes bacterium]|nr:hypothetical protein [Armatimonadota bacterium]
MTQDPAVCPICRAALREGGCFCPACGVEVRPRCPACGDAPRWLATLGVERSPWCEGCESLVEACELCGRWLPPGSGPCPDPQCGGRVLPLLPQYTGRRWDGRGSAVAWEWPLIWERQNPEFRAPAVERYPCEEPLHAAFAAHGRLYLWLGSTLLSPGEDWARPGTAEWRSSLGPGGATGSLLPFAERAAVAGSRVVLAREGRFVCTDLRHPGDSAALPGGAPLAQAGGPGWWVGWSREAGGPVLRVARVGDAGEFLDPRPLKAPPEAAPAPGSRLVLRDGQAHWAGRDGAIWSLECAREEVRRRIEPTARPAEAQVRLWAEPDGPRLAREIAGQIALTLIRAPDSPGALTVPAGRGPLTGVFASAAHVLVLGERAALFHARTGERLDEAARPPGRWIDGALVRDGAGEPRLLLLTVEEGIARVSSYRIASGAQTVVWQGAGEEPLALLPVAETLYVVLRTEVLRLRATPPQETGSASNSP